MLSRKISLAVNLLIFALVLAAWLMMTTRVDRHGALSSTGLRSLRYFTVLSNLLEGIASLVYAIGLIRLLRGGAPLPRGIVTLKYVATVSVALTFVTVLCFLGPGYGFDKMYTGANFWMHLVIPVLAMLELFLLDRDPRLPIGRTFLATAPMLLYALFYTGNLLMNGMETGGHSNDWYGFAKGGIPMAVLRFLILYLTDWLLAVLLRLPGVKG